MTHELGPLPYPAAEAAMNLCADHQGPVEAMQFLPEDTQLFTADQMRAYALAEVARAVEAERERCARLCEQQASQERNADHNAACMDCAEAIRKSAQAHGQTPGEGS